MHDHHHHHQSAEDLDGGLEQLDTANQSLANALRSSFRVLKVILVTVVILYLFSGVGCLEQNQQALVLRFGRLQEDVLGPGLYSVFPRPIDELIVVPVNEKRTTRVLTQQMFLKQNEDGTYQSFEEAAAPQGGGLDPTKHGTVMTGDRELIHAEWIVTYTIDDLKRFVSNILLATEQSEEDLIRVAVENSAIDVIGQQVAVDAVLNKIDYIREQVKLRAQQTLDHIGPRNASDQGLPDEFLESGSGIKIATIVPKLYWPKATKSVFDSVTKASNERDKARAEARQDATNWLMGAAGPAYQDLISEFDAYLAAKTSGEESTAGEKMAAIEDIILTRATGQAGERIRQAESFKKKALEDIKADYDEYISHLDAYKSNRDLLFARLWQDTQKEIMTNPNVSKRHLLAGQKEFQLWIGPDPEEQKEREVEGYKEKKRKPGDFTKVKGGDDSPIIKPRRGEMVQ